MHSNSNPQTLVSCLVLAMAVIEGREASSSHKQEFQSTEAILLSRLPKVLSTSRPSARPWPRRTLKHGQICFVVLDSRRRPRCDAWVASTALPSGYATPDNWSFCSTETQGSVAGLQCARRQLDTPWVDLTNPDVSISLASWANPEKTLWNGLLRRPPRGRQSAISHPGRW